MPTCNNQIFSNQTEFVEELRRQQNDKKVDFIGCTFNFEFDIHRIAEEYRRTTNDISLFQFIPVNELDDGDYKKILHTCRKQQILVINKRIRFLCCTFAKTASWKETRFASDTNFNLCRFSSAVNFFVCDFSGEATFTLSKFLCRLTFSWSMFFRNANFKRITFSGEALFCQSTFSGDAYFNNATFQDQADFSGIKATQQITFEESVFEKTFRASYAKINRIVLQNSLLNGPIIFHLAELKKPDRETCRALKHQYRTINNMIEANQWYVHEMNAFREELQKKMNRTKAWKQLHYFIKRALPRSIRRSILQNMSNCFVYKELKEVIQGALLLFAEPPENLQKDSEKQATKLPAHYTFGNFSILKLQQWSTNFGQSWGRGVVFTLLVSVITFFFMLLCSWCSGKIQATTICQALSYYLYYMKCLFDISADNPVTEKLLPDSPLRQALYHFVDLTGRIFIAYGIYQTIQAFRKFRF